MRPTSRCTLMQVPLPTSRRHAASLWLLLALFAVRVVAQPLSLVFSAVLPRFDSWYSGVVPYPVLLVSQVVILWLLADGARQVGSGVVRWRQRTGRVLLALGAVYFASMALRLVLGLTILRSHPWVGHTLPAAFHLVLATYLLLYARVQVRYGARD